MNKELEYLKNLHRLNISQLNSTKITSEKLDYVEAKRKSVYSNLKDYNQAEVCREILGYIVWLEKILVDCKLNDKIYAKALSNALNLDQAKVYLSPENFNILQENVREYILNIYNCLKLHKLKAGFKIKMLRKEMAKLENAESAETDTNL